MQAVTVHQSSLNAAFFDMLSAVRAYRGSSHRPGTNALRLPADELATPGITNTAGRRKGRI